jgi:hypothetical protein
VLAQAPYMAPVDTPIRVELRTSDAALRCAIAGGPVVTATGQGPAAGSLALLATGAVSFSDVETRAP